MTKVEAKARVFQMAFDTLSREEKETVVKHLLEDYKIREDIIDIALIEQRKKECARPFREYLAERKSK